MPGAVRKSGHRWGICPQSLDRGSLCPAIQKTQAHRQSYLCLQLSMCMEISGISVQCKMGPTVHLQCRCWCERGRGFRDTTYRSPYSRPRLRAITALLGGTCTLVTLAILTFGFISIILASVLPVYIVIHALESRLINWTYICLSPWSVMPALCSQIYNFLQCNDEIVESVSSA